MKIISNSRRRIINKLIETNGFKSIKDPKLRGYFNRIFDSTIELYGQYIDWNKVYDLLNKTEIIIDKEEMGLAGTFQFIYGDVDDKKNRSYSCILVLSDAISLFTKICTLAHEFCHLCSVNLNNSTIDKDGNITILEGMQIKYLKHGEDVYEHGGDAINEGITQFVANNIAYNCYKNTKIKCKIAGVVNNFSSDLRYNWLTKRAELLYKNLGDKLFKAYFSGEDKIIQKEFDKLVGKGGWEDFVSYLDDIFDIDEQIEEIELKNEIDQKDKNDKINDLNKALKVAQEKSDSILYKFIRNKLEVNKTNNRKLSNCSINRVKKGMIKDYRNCKLKDIERLKIQNTIMHSKLCKELVIKVKFQIATSLSFTFQEYLTKIHG